MQPSASFPPTIGRYVVQRVLGSGAMGSVLLAEDPKIKRKVAIKVVKLDAIRSDKDREEFMARFQREAEVSGVLNHPGIVAIYDVGEEEGVGPFLAMEFVAGQPLDAVIKGREPMAMDQKLRVLAELADALDHAHAAGIVHRDVKPGNVMLTESGRPKLMDFGIAKREDAGLTQTGTFLGTPSYAAPEQIKEGVVDARSDVFSFGVMAYELFSYQSPFPGSSINTILYRIVNEPPAEPRPPVDGIGPDGWKKVFDQVLAKDPEKRYQSCSAFVRDLMTEITSMNTGDQREVLKLLKMDPAAPPPTVVRRPSDSTVIGDPAGLPPIATPLPGEMPAQPLPEPRKRGLALPVGIGVAVLAAGGYFVFGAKGGSSLLIRTTPDKVVVSVNGAPLPEPSPVQARLKSGDRVHFEAKGFEAKDLIFSGEQDFPKVVSLSPISVQVKIASVPDEAQVVLDGQSMGTTPFITNWNEGQVHQLTLSKAGMEPLHRDYAVGELPGNEPLVLAAQGTPQLPTPNTPAPTTAFLRLAGGFTIRLRVNGEDKGELQPGSRLPLPPGNYKLEMSNPKVFYAGSQSVSLGLGQEGRIALPGLATLTVGTHPGVGDVFIDGKPAGIQSDGSSVRLSEGRHSLTIKSSKGSHTETVNVSGDQSVDIKL